MRLLRRGLRVIAAGAVTVAVGVAVNQILNGGRWNLRWLVAAVVLAALAEALDLWLGTHDNNSSRNDTLHPILWPSLADEDGMPLRLREVTSRDLGVHRSRFGAEGNSPYIRRQADDLLADALASDPKRLIIVEGPRLAGATRTLAEAAQVNIPDHLVAGFVDDPRVSLADMITDAGRWAADADGQAAGVVLWLDSLSPGRFAELASVPLGDLPPGVLVLATLDTDELEGLRIPEQLDRLLDQHAVRIRLTAVTEQERRDLQAQEAYAALRPVLDQHDDFFLGRLMVAWEPLRAALTRGGSEQATDRVALLRAVTDWYRVYLPRLLSADVLSYLYRAYRGELISADPGIPVSVAGFHDALQWAMAPPAAGRPRLIDLQDVPGGQRYAPHPLLAVIADDPEEDAGWPVADALWSYADQYFRGDQRRDIGYSALARGACKAAARLLSHADTTVDPGAYDQLARLFYERSDWAGSRNWWRQAANTGDPDQAPKAMLNLGLLEQEQGDMGQARHWYQRAIGTGHPDVSPKAMNNLGLLEHRQGDVGQARHWYHQAIGTGHPDAAPKAMVNLGTLEYKQGDAGQARHWYQQAIGTGHPDSVSDSMLGLGLLERGQGDVGQARHWYQQASGTGHPDNAPKAMASLGVLEYEQGDVGQARHWFQQAIGTGHPDAAPKAMVDLGLLEEQQGDAGQAGYWFHQAIGTGHPDQAPKAMFSLGLLEHRQGDVGQARHWYQQAIGTGHPDQAPKAMNNLGLVEKEQGDLGQARHWYHQAIGTGHHDAAPNAMLNLGNLEKEQGDLGQARHWYHQAIGTGHPDAVPKAMLNLGTLEKEQGDLGQARHWYQQAIGTGHHDVARQAQQELRVLDQREDERLRGEHFGRYGYLAYADPDLMNRDEQYSGTPDAGVSDRAPEPDLGDSPMS